MNFCEIILKWILNWIIFWRNSNIELNQFGYRSPLVKRPQQPVKAFSRVCCVLWQCFSSSSLVYQIDYSLFCKRVPLKSQGQPLNHLEEYYTQLPSVSVSTCDLLMTFLLLLATFRRNAELANFEAKISWFWKWPVTPQMTYPLLLATGLTLDLRRNAELPKFLVSKLKMTSDLVTDVSLVVSNLSYFGPSLKCRLPKITKDCQTWSSSKESAPCT